LACNFDDLQLRLFNVIQFERLVESPFMVSYLTSIVSNIVSVSVFEISDVEVL